jgi:hypothetical protein
VEPPPARQFLRARAICRSSLGHAPGACSARLEGRKVATGSLCIAAAVPPTTALRWIKTLCDQRVFERTADPEDKARKYISIGDQAAASMNAYFTAAGHVLPLVS